MQALERGLNRVQTDLGSVVGQVRGEKEKFMDAIQLEFNRHGIALDQVGACSPWSWKWTWCAALSTTSWRMSSSAFCGPLRGLGGSMSFCQVPPSRLRCSHRVHA